MRPCLFLLIIAASAAGFAQESTKKTDNDIPVISGDLGSCSADFTVTTTNSKPIYKAKVTVELRSGFGGFHRTSLEIYTNVDGKARVEGLPSKSKKALSFDVSYEGRGTSVVVDTAQKCQGSYMAMVTDKVVATEPQ